MKQIRNAYIGICTILLAVAACSRTVRYGMDGVSQAEARATTRPGCIHSMPPQPDWFLFLERAGATLAEHAAQGTLPDEYKLHHAAYRGNATELAEWIAARPKWINKIMKGSIVPLHLAVFQGNVECVRLLLEEGADAGALMDPQHAYVQPIHIAAQGNALGILRALVRAQPTVVADCDATGKTALHWAAAQGHLLCVQELLQAGSNPNSEDHEGHTPLCFAFAKNHSGVVTQLVKGGANIDCITCMHNDSDQLLRWALAQKAYKCIAAVVRKGNVSIDLYRKDVAGETLLDCALKTDHFPSMRHLLWGENGDNWVNYVDQNGTPFLHHTILGNRPTLLAELLATGTLDVNVQDARGKTALHLAAERGLLSQLQQLLAKFGIDVNKKDNEGQTALYASVVHKRMEIAKILMQVPTVEVLQGNAHNQTLLEAAFEANDVPFAKKLFDSGQDIVHAKNASGKTPLHRAAETGRLEMLHALSTVPGIDANATNLEDGYTPLHLAAKNGHADAIDVLLKIPGINAIARDYWNFTPLHWTAVEGHAGAAGALLKAPGMDANAANVEGNTPLHLAASNGHADLVQTLLGVPGMEVNATNIEGNMPLHLAASNGHAEVVKALLGAPGLEVDAKNGEGYTPLHWAAANGNTVIAVLLKLKVPGGGNFVQDPRNGRKCQKRKGQ